MIVNGNLPDFACNIISKGQITLGDVRRLQRNYLPGGITNREELEILISLNAKLVRADKVWAQWLVSAVAIFIKTRKASERSLEDAAGKWVERLFATSATKLGLRIARQIRRELSRLRAIQLARAGEGVQACDVQEPGQVKVPEYDPADCSLRNNPGAESSHCEPDESPACLRPPRYTVRHEAVPRTNNLASATRGWCLATYVQNAQRNHLINFQSSRVSLVLAPCL
jgi:hypothetical protein